MRIVPNGKLVLAKRRQTSTYRAMLRTAGRKKHFRYIGSKSARAGLVVSLNSPKVFQLVSNTDRDNLLRFVRQIQDALNAGNQVLLNFSSTEKLHSCGTLYFLANIDILLNVFPGKIKCKRPKNSVVEQLFQHVGLLEKLGRSGKVPVTAENVVNWHYATGTDASTSAFKSLLVQHGDAMGGLVARSSLYDCMSEAVTNTRKHAYPSSYQNPLPQWWMFSQANSETLEVVICDLGIGIPKSLIQKPQMRDYFRKLLMVGRPSSHDKELIKVATSTNRSSTGLEYRGKGLPQMLEFIKQGSTGGFRAQSGAGAYAFDASSRRERTATFKHPIKGTLIQWTIQLNTGRE